MKEYLNQSKDLKDLKALCQGYQIRLNKEIINQYSRKLIDQTFF